MESEWDSEKASSKRKKERKKEKERKKGVYEYIQVSSKLESQSNKLWENHLKWHLEING